MPFAASTPTIPYPNSLTGFGKRVMSRPARPVALLWAAAPLLLLFGIALLFRGLQAQTTRTGSGPATANAVNAAPPAPADLAALNAARRRADDDEAYQAAQNLVRQFLLTDAARKNARFPPHLTGEGVSIEKQTPTLFRVRAHIEWPAQNGEAPPAPRRFEADLRHGPADNKWHLVDTEFLDERSALRGDRKR